MGNLLKVLKIGIGSLWISTYRINGAGRIAPAVYVEYVAIWEVCNQRMQQLFSQCDRAFGLKVALSWFAAYSLTQRATIFFWIFGRIWIRKIPRASRRGGGICRKLRQGIPIIMPSRKFAKIELETVNDPKKE